ncbi:DNA alkylation repair protein [Gordonia sp. TBRC 11910]|uniref:DNA alkylation repair protein n=1 Tax=Gordonia asplenii TaxID=2725283 RepID=A0A848KTC7_9ACTN|nr:DNA alkylation repair protein [Gordonia asplenii]NMO02194.1 DNA alkylation repair protein [Gordonia asplenii]
MTQALTAAAVREALAELADPKRAVSSAGFFKTGPGEYGEGDEFIGISVPAQRKAAKRFRGIDADEIDVLLDSPVHEHRLTALIIMRTEFEKAATSDREFWVRRYCAAVDRGRVNNWDLVDSSAGIVGDWAVAQENSKLLLDYAEQEDLWRRRVGVVGTYSYLTAGDGSATLAVAPLVVDDRRDLIQKALGWMLREMGKRVDRELLTGYLDVHAAQLGRTALSYATEHLSVEERKAYRAMK